MAQPQVYDTIAPLTAASVPQGSDLPSYDPSSGAAQGANSEREEMDPKTGKRNLFGLGKKRMDHDSQATAASVLHSTPPTSNPASQTAPADGGALLPQSPALPRTITMANSPGLFRSHSPRLHSPADSEIFERNVQEPTAISSLTTDGPAHIPTHVMTEDYIPPALEASAQAITSGELNPDEVEIVTSAAHQSAAASMLESTASLGDFAQSQSPIVRHERMDESEPASLHHSGILSHLSSEADDGASNYGQLDPNDVRRLSFISFADVVQSEHQNFAADGASQVSLHSTSMSSNAAYERNTSPLRSPRSPASRHGVITPPLPGVNLNLANAGPRAELSPVRSATTASSTGQHGELTIETMTQAVRKTASGDLSGVRSAGMSPISDETSLTQNRSRTNT